MTLRVVRYFIGRLIDFEKKSTKMVWLVSIH